MRLDKYPRKRNGMYILKNSDYDEIAEMIFVEYMPSVLLYPRAVDIEHLIQECFYLDIKHDVITPDGNILGMMAFADTQFETVDYDNNPRNIELNEGTMLIDMSLIGSKNRPRANFTKAHELAHWICHRSYHSPYKQAYDFRYNAGVIACRAENIEQYKKTLPNQVYSDTYWEEHQADRLAAALLMPKKTFVDACKETLKEYGINRGYLIPGIDNHVAKRVIAQIARVYDVSMRAAQVRMINLGFIRA